MHLKSILLGLAALIWINGPARAEIIVYAPAALGEVLESLQPKAAAAGHAFKLVTGHSPAQAKGIEEGAPADIFISVDPQWTAYLDGKHLLVSDSIADFAATQLVMVAAADSSLRYDAKPGEVLAPLLAGGRLALSDPEMTPAGRFARSALEKLGQWQAVKDQLALQSNVRAVVAMVERGEVPLGIGYASDVARSPKVKVLAVFGPDAAAPVRFPLALVAGHDSPEARAVLMLLKGADAAAILKDRGFLLP